MGSRHSRHEQARFSFARNGSPRKSYDSDRRKSAEEKVNGRDHAYRQENPKFTIPENTQGIPRLEVQHYLMRYLYQGNFSSPRGALNAEGSRILDLGCGAGTWAIEVAKEFPNCEVTGVDISAYFPINHDTPNVKFLEHNFQECNRLPFDDNTFDLVHMRFLLADVKERDIENALIPELVRVTKPNGWIELLEFDIQHFSDGPTTRRLTNALMRHLQSNGYNGQISDKLPQYLKKTQQIDVVNQYDKAITLGRWAGKVGELAIDDISRLFSDNKELSRSMGITDEEYQKLIEAYKQEVETKRTFFRTHRFYAQKIEKAPQPKSPTIVSYNHKV
ncbi:646_t:CDS:2 [Ambispora leptoticha]|uniref:646_t:CDS:1 n=1 Tax=Ambispora leptoticha TaxID=144679 RepID=A0A9N9F554_9GLOM|nr:646_t:CDS:2 [Ambispora leptoticha]